MFHLNSTPICSVALRFKQINYISLTTGPKGPVLQVYTKEEEEESIPTYLLIVYKGRYMSLYLTIGSECEWYLNELIVVSNHFPLFLAVLEYNNA